MTATAVTSLRVFCMIWSYWEPEALVTSTRRAEIYIMGADMKVHRTIDEATYKRENTTNAQEPVYS